MARHKAPKRYNRRENLLKLMSMENVTVTEMSAQIKERAGYDIAPQNLGQLIKDGDDFQNLTDERAEQIIAAYPQYRIQWLMGYDDFKTDAELVAFMLAGVESAKSGSEAPALGGTALDASMYLMGQLSGFELSLWRNRLDDARNVEQAVDEIKRGCIVSRYGKSAEIDIDRWGEIANEVCDFVKFKLQREIDRANPARKGERQ